MSNVLPFKWSSVCQNNARTYDSRTLPIVTFSLTELVYRAIVGLFETQHERSCYQITLAEFNGCGYPIFKKIDSFSHNSFALRIIGP